MHLSKIQIENYKGIEKLEVDFNPNINIIIGENGCCKSALIDAIRLLYNIGEPIRDISVNQEDFFEQVIEVDGIKSIKKANQIKIVYEFRGLTNAQKGALYECMVIDPNNTKNDYARIELEYNNLNKKYPVFSYYTGKIEGQRAEYKTFELFQHYYLGALRDSTKDLISTRGNVLGKVIKRLIDREESEEAIKSIMKGANDALLERSEVSNTRDNVNTNLEAIFKNYFENKIGVHIEQSKVEYIVNVIKPFLPHNRDTLKDEGFQLWQNSLGFNNLIYIATVLGDIKERIVDDSISHYALLIEEPESHLHPQLQLNLYNFLISTKKSGNSQLFITTHSPTLTSKVPFENLILLDKIGYRISNIFNDREAEKIIEDSTKSTPLFNKDIQNKSKKLERYIDVTKSQLFYAKSILLVEGITEELLISSFAKQQGFNLEDYRIETVNVRGTSFYPFLFLFNSTTEEKRLNKNVTVISDDDRFPDSKDYSFNELVDNNFVFLDEIQYKISHGTPCTRISNLQSVKNSQQNILIKTAYQTFEYELCLSNISDNSLKIKENFLFKYLLKIQSEKIKKINEYIDNITDSTLSDEVKQRIAILLWKAMPLKAEFAQDFSIYIVENIDDAKQNLIIPDYIVEGLNHLKK